MKIRSRFLNLCIAWLATLALRILFLTVRFHHWHAAEDGTPYRRSRGRQRYIFCLWHDAIVLCIFGHRTWELSGLISQHTDGGYLADAARLANIVPVRGSTTRGGAGAVRQLLDMPHLHLAITPDGPQGPRRKLKDGLVFLASRSGRPVVPTGLAVTRCWRITGRWSDLVIPRPFARLYAVAGPPIDVPPDITRDEIPGFLDAINAEMIRLESVAQRLAAGDSGAADEISVTADPTHAHQQSQRAA